VPVIDPSTHDPDRVVWAATPAEPPVTTADVLREAEQITEEAS
jgi:hypothetical protein